MKSIFNHQTKNEMIETYFTLIYLRCISHLIWVHEEDIAKELGLDDNSVCLFSGAIANFVEKMFVDLSSSNDITIQERDDLVLRARKLAKNHYKILTVKSGKETP